MNNQKQIEVIEDKIKKLQKEVEKLKAKEWIPEKGEYYWLLNCALDTINYYHNSTVDEKIIKYNKIFKTKEEAQDYADYLKAKKEYSYDFSTEEWNDGRTKKYSVYFDFCNKQLYVDKNYCANYIGRIIFKSKEKAEEFIKNYRKQILKYEFGVDE